MTDEIGTIIVEHLLAIRAEQDRHNDEVILLLGNLERDCTSMKVDFAAQQERLDRFDNQLVRIKTGAGSR